MLLRCVGGAGGGSSGGTGCGDVGTFAFLVGSAFALFAALFFWRRLRRLVDVRSKNASVVITGGAGGTLGSVAGA